MPADPIDVPADLTGLASAIRRHVYGPRTEALLGVRPHTLQTETIPPPWVPCWCCGAVRDESGKVVDVHGVDPATGEPFTVRTGIHAGDPLACGACTCLEPSVERRAPRSGKPVNPNPDAKPAGPPQLTAKDRRTIAKTVPGRVWLAMLDVEEAGDTEEAGRLQTLLYRHRDREIDDAGLEQLAAGSPESDDEIREYHGADAIAHCRLVP